MQLPDIAHDFANACLASKLIDCRYRRPKLGELWCLQTTERNPAAVWANDTIKVIREFARKMMQTEDVRIDTSLNQAVWRKGIRNVPYRIRVRMQRKRSDDENAEDKLYTLVSFVQVDSFKGLESKAVEDEE